MSSLLYNGPSTEFIQAKAEKEFTEQLDIREIMENFVAGSTFSKFEELYKKGGYVGAMLIFDDFVKETTNEEKSLFVAQCLFDERG